MKPCRQVNFSRRHVKSREEPSAAQPASERTKLILVNIGDSAANTSSIRINIPAIEHTTHGDNVFQTKRLRRARRQEQNRAQTGFFDLPAELRLEIYRLVLDSGHAATTKHVPIVGIEILPFPKLGTSILRTCRLIFREAVPILYEALECKADLPVHEMPLLASGHWPKYGPFGAWQTKLTLPPFPSYGLQNLRTLVLTGENGGYGGYRSYATIIGHGFTSEGRCWDDAMWKSFHEQTPSLRHVRICFKLMEPLQPNFQARFIGGIARGKKIEDVSVEVLEQITDSVLEKFELPGEAREGMAQQLGRAFKVAILDSAQTSEREIKVDVQCLPRGHT